MCVFDLSIFKKKIFFSIFSFNFAEAALLIHGTTTVYVRKVEYVLQQAQNFFEQLRESTKEEEQPKGSKRRKGQISSII